MSSVGSDRLKRAWRRTGLRTSAAMDTAGHYRDLIAWDTNESRLLTGAISPKAANMDINHNS